MIAQTGPGWAATLVHYAVPYVLLLALIGAGAPRPRSAAVRAIGCFLAFVVAYYAVVLVQFGAVPVRYAAAWLIAAVTVCPLAAVAVRWAVSRDGLLPGAVLAAGGAAALADGTLGNILRVLAGDRAVQPQPVSALAGLAVALVLALALPRSRGTRTAAVVLLVPFAVASTSAGWALHFGPGPYR
jgi:hypothetical protein